MALVQSTTNSTAGGASLALTLNGVNPSNMLVLLISSNVALTSGLGSWSTLNAPALYTVSGFSVNSLIYFLPMPASGTNTVTVAPAAGVMFGGACMLEWSGFTASPIDVAPAASNVTAGGTSGSASIASGVLTQPSEVLFAICTNGTTGAGQTNVGMTDPPTGFTSLFAAQNSVVNNCWEMCYQQVNSTASVTPNWTWTDSATIFSQATIGSLKLAAAATSKPFGMLLGVGT